jgi:hypothetical protein
MRRKLAAAGMLLAGVALVRRRSMPEPRVDLYYDDGSTLALTGDDARPLLEIARSALR